MLLNSIQMHGSIENNNTYAWGVNNLLFSSCKVHLIIDYFSLAKQ